MKKISHLLTESKKVYAQGDRKPKIYVLILFFLYFQSLCVLFFFNFFKNLFD